MANKGTRGAIAWMTKNPVAANILLVILMGGGIMQISSLKQEIFPEFTLDSVMVSVAYPGASPKEVESGVILALEESLRGIDGVKRVTTTASEGMGSANVELLLGTDVEKATDDIKSAVDQIRTFPNDAEKAIVKRFMARNEVISLVIFGDTDDQTLRHFAEMAREDLLQSDKITIADLIGSKAREIAIEVPYQNLKANGLSLMSIAQQVKASSIEVPAGQLRTSSQDLALRTNDKLDFGPQYESIVVKSAANGEKLLLKDIATIKDTFEESDSFASYNKKPAVMVRVFRTGEQRPTEIADEVKSYVDEFQEKLPEGLSATIWNDYSLYLSGRIDLLVRNAFLGLVLVFFVLGLFLKPKLAFWVTMGIPISFLGAFMLLPTVDISINMISLFAFIVTLGMVVDDAIVVGENIFEHQKKGESKLHSAISGAKEISVPVIFAILTTMAAFSPLFFVPGVMGKFFNVIPAIVVLVLLISLLESLLILPHHLAHTNDTPSRLAIAQFLSQKQKQFSHWFLKFVDRVYRPSARFAIEYRYFTFSASIAVLVLVFGLIGSGFLQFSFMPKMDSDIILLHSEFDVGTPIEKSKDLQIKLLQSAERTLENFGGKEKAQGFYSQVGATISPGGPDPSGQGGSGAHIVDVMAYLVTPDQRNFSSDQFSSAWEKELGEVPGLKSLTFLSTTGPSAGKPISLQLSHKNIETLEASAKKLAQKLSEFHGVNSIEDGIAQGKEQIEFKLKESAHRLGITSNDLGLQLRNSFYGAEAIRRQRQRDEVKVMVRLPKNERDSIYDIENFRIQTSQGEVLIGEVAEIIRSKGYAQIKREDGARVISVTADIVEGQANANEVVANLEKEFIPILLSATPGLEVNKAGEQREQAETMQSLGLGFLFALLIIYALLAIPLKSYTQPLIVMVAIPFGIVGAAVGHVIMGFNLSIISMMGLVALSGIVVNDTLVLVHAANNYLAHHKSVEEAILNAGVRRFRPIILTSLTTFFGLIPMILETSLQARFLIPMAISIGFGVMFATVIILILVPALYMILNDIHSIRLFRSKTLSSIPVDQEA